DVATDTLYEPGALFVPLMLRQTATTPCTCSVLVRREVVERVGGFEDAFRRVYTDQAFYAKVLLDWPVFVADGCWDRYRQHPGSCCQVVERSGQQDAARLAFLEWLEGYLAARGVEDGALWRE